MLAKADIIILGLHLSTAANDPRPSASFSPRKNPQWIPANTPPVFSGLRPCIRPRLLRLVTKAMSDRLLAYLPLPDILLSDYQSFSGREYLNILLFRIVPVNPHIRASKSIQSLNWSRLARLAKRGSSQTALHCAHRTSTVSSRAFCKQEG